MISADIALLFALPLTREEFEYGVQGQAYADYVKGMLRRRAAQAVWEHDYVPVVTAAESLIRRARELGIAVYSRTGLAEIAEATARYQTVVLLAHFRGWPVSADDFRFHEEEVLKRARDSQEAIFELLAHPVASIGELVEEMNEALRLRKPLSLIPRAIVDIAMGSELLEQTASRDILDETLTGLIAPGNLVELFDGLHAPGIVERAIATSFVGELDLSLCDSEVLAMLIDIRRNNSIRRAYFPNEIDPLPHLIMIRTAIEWLAKYGGSYLDIRIRLFLDLKRKPKEIDR